MVNTEPTRICRDCGVRKPWSDFYPKAKWPDGTTRQPHCYCKPCHQVRTNEWERKRAATDPEWRRKRARRQRDLIKRDPERYAASLAYRREWARKRYGYRRVLRKVDVRVAYEMLDPKPFADWLRELKEREGVSNADLELRLGVSERTLGAILSGGRQVELGTVERALLADDTATLRDVYPELYEAAA